MGEEGDGILEWDFWTAKAHPQWHNSSNETTSPNPSWTVHQLGTKHSDMWSYAGHSHSNHHNRITKAFEEPQWKMAVISCQIALVSGLTSQPSQRNVPTIYKRGHNLHRWAMVKKIHCFFVLLYYRSHSVDDSPEQPAHKLKHQVTNHCILVISFLPSNASVDLFLHLFWWNSFVCETKPVLALLTPVSLAHFSKLR